MKGEIKLENFKATPGQVDEDKFYGNDAMGKREKEKALALDAAIRAKMSPSGTLNLPPMLEKRRLDYGITDGAFREQAAFERIFVYQIPLAIHAGSKIGGGVLYKPETTQSAEQRGSSRGILVSAGLRALDHLRTNGIDLGHIVRFIHMAPFSVDVDYLATGMQVSLIDLNVGDILSSEDLALQLRVGEMEILFQEFGEESHHIVWPVARRNEVHQATLPTNPFKSDDY